MVKTDQFCPNPTKRPGSAALGNFLPPSTTPEDNRRAPFTGRIVPIPTFYFRLFPRQEMKKSIECKQAWFLSEQLRRAGDSIDGARG